MFSGVCRLATLPFAGSGRIGEFGDCGFRRHVDAIRAADRHAFPPGDTSTVSIFLYKGKEESGLLGSRGSVWDEAVSVIQANPWFGSGFGTSLDSGEADVGFGQYSSLSNTTKSMAIVTWRFLKGVGLLGVVPFFALVLMLALKVRGVFARLRQTLNFGTVDSVAMILTAGLVHAAFEDWLFAVGYYLCVFFWVLAFAFIDIIPAGPTAVPRPIPGFGFGTIRTSPAVVAPQR